MTDVLIDGRVIPVPPGWVIRVTLERLADDVHPVTTRGGDAGYSRQGVSKEPHDGGARRPGTEHEPSIDELDPLPVMARHRSNGVHRTAPDAPRKVPGLQGKECPGCKLRCGSRSRACPNCGHRFLAPKVSV